MNCTHVFFDNGIVKHFSVIHCFAGILAIIVLVFIIFLPMLYTQLYPFKLFHRLLGWIHRSKEISGPFKMVLVTPLIIVTFLDYIFFEDHHIVFTCYENGDIILH